MTTLASYFSELRAKAELSYSEVAKKAGKISRHVVWKLENGKPIKASTLGLIMSRGLGIREGSPAYIKAFVLWTEAQAGTTTAPDLSLALGKMKVADNRQFDAFARQVVGILADVPADDRPQVLEALRNIPALKLWLASRK